MDRLLHSQPLPVHPGMVGDRGFLLMAGFGFDGDAVQMVTKPLKKRLGAAAHLFAGVVALARPKPVLRVTTAGSGKLRGTWVVGARGRRYGGPFFCPSAPQPFCGGLGAGGGADRGDIAFCPDQPVAGHRFCCGRHQAREARGFSVLADGPLRAHMDGDYIGRATEFEVGVSEVPLAFCLPGRR